MFRKDLIGYEVERFVCPAGWATAATVSEEPAFRAPYNCTVQSVRFVPKTAITGNATNFASLEARNKGAAGVGTTQVAVMPFDTPTTDDVVAYDEKAIPLSATAANLNLVEGDVLALRKTVGGTGMIIDGIIEVAFGPRA